MKGAPSQTVVLVEDHAATRLALSRLLALQDLRVVAMATLADARAYLATELPDLLITDVRLDGGNGLQLIASLPRHVPSIVLTGFSDAVIEADARQLGAAFMLKPAEPAKLISVVRSALCADAGNVYSAQRRWRRKPVRQSTAASLQGASARLVDVSYGGACLIMSDDSANLRAAAAFELPSANLEIPFTVHWVRRGAHEAGVVCGGSVPEAQRPVWMSVVDALT